MVSGLNPPGGRPTDRRSRRGGPVGNRPESKAQRDRVNAKVMKDSRMKAPGPKAMPFDVRKMAYGGFRAFVEA